MRPPSRIPTQEMQIFLDLNEGINKKITKFDPKERHGTLKMRKKIR